MKKFYFIIIIVLSLFSCNDQKTKSLDSHSEYEQRVDIFSGDLYFKLISFGSFYNMPDSIINRFEKEIDRLSNTEDITEEDKVVLDYYSLLEKNDLIEKPYIHLQIDSSQNVTVYLCEHEYEKVRIYDRQQLINENKKVKITIKGRIIHEGIIDGTEVVLTKKIDGKTYWRK